MRRREVAHRHFLHIEESGGETRRKERKRTHQRSGRSRLKKGRAGQKRKPAGRQGARLLKEQWSSSQRTRSICGRVTKRRSEYEVVETRRMHPQFMFATKASGWLRMNFVEMICIPKNFGFPKSLAS